MWRIRSLGICQLVLFPRSLPAAPHPSLFGRDDTQAIAAQLMPPPQRAAALTLGQMVSIQQRRESESELDRLYRQVQDGSASSGVAAMDDASDGE